MNQRKILRNVIVSALAIIVLVVAAIVCSSASGEAYDEAYREYKSGRYESRINIDGEYTGIHFFLPDDDLWCVPKGDLHRYSYKEYWYFDDYFEESLGDYYDEYWDDIDDKLSSIKNREDIYIVYKPSSSDKERFFNEDMKKCQLYEEIESGRTLIDVAKGSYRNYLIFKAISIAAIVITAGLAVYLLINLIRCLRRGKEGKAAAVNGAAADYCVIYNDEIIYRTTKLDESKGYIDKWARINSFHLSVDGYEEIAERNFKTWRIAVYAEETGEIYQQYIFIHSNIPATKTLKYIQVYNTTATKDLSGKVDVQKNQIYSSMDQKEVDRFLKKWIKENTAASNLTFTENPGNPAQKRAVISETKLPSGSIRRVFIEIEEELKVVKNE